MKKKHIILLSLALWSLFTYSQTIISVDTKNVRYVMEGGIGASWHAIELDSVDNSEEWKYARREINNRGSAWGGNPPVSHAKAWDQIIEHANWLGLNWMRIELAMRMYEPDRLEFQWDNNEMKALYRILDWAEGNNVDVFLQQMWSNVEWNTYPNVQPLISAPRSIDDFAEGIATLLDHLINTKKYTCVKWFCISNEPPGPAWGDWWSMGDEVPEINQAYQAQLIDNPPGYLNGHPGTPAPFTPALEAVRETLDDRNISIPLSGPDWTGLPGLNPDWIDFDDYIGAYDLHSYESLRDGRIEVLRPWVDWATERNKPIFLSEIGNMQLGWGGSNEGPKTMAAALSNALDILQGMDLGVDAFNRWSFTNRSNLDGQWQLLRTWDVENERYYEVVTPEPVAYYAYGVITRYLAKNSTVVKTQQSDFEVYSQTVVSPEGNLSTFIVNEGDKEIDILLDYQGVTQEELYLYRAVEKEIKKPGYKMNAVAKIYDTKKAIELKIPPKSINTLTSIEVQHHQNAQNK